MQVFNFILTSQQYAFCIKAVQFNSIQFHSIQLLDYNVHILGYGNMLKLTISKINDINTNM